MAHIFDIAIELEYLAPEVTWSAGRGRPSSWRRFSYGRSLEMTMTAPQKHFGQKLYLGESQLPHLPHPLRHELLSGKCRLSYTSRQQEFELIVGHAAKENPGPGRPMNPWTLRNEFLGLKDTSNHSLVKFLNKCGEWSDESELGARRYSSDDKTRIFLASRFWEDRKKIRLAIKEGVSKWHDGPYGSGFRLARRAEYPHLLLPEVFCLDAILHSVTLDLLRGVKFRVCAREDCRKPFPVESGHGKIYCEQYCGHLVSLRNKREGKKISKKSKAMSGGE